MDRTRREVLKGAGLLLILGSAGSPEPQTAPAGAETGQGGYDPFRHRWGMTIDIDRCIGCGNCVRACERENDVPEGYFRTWIEKYEIEGSDLEHPRVSSPDGGKNGFPPSGDTRAKQFFVPKLCNHCHESPCVQVCPVGATFDSPDGVVLVDESYCLGCRYCVQACPYGCRYIHPKKRTVDKCTLCYHRITRGLTTACCEACPTQARRLADLKDPRDPVHAFLKENRIQVLKPHMATRPKVFYRALDGAVR